MTGREFECIQHQLSLLRRENRFLKFGLIVCFALSALPYLVGFQPETIRAKRVVTERVEFVNRDEAVASITADPEGYGILIDDKNGSHIVFFGNLSGGTMVGVYNNEGKIVAILRALLGRGMVAVSNKDGRPVATMSATTTGGSVGISDNDGQLLGLMVATPIEGKIVLKTPSGRTVWSAP